MKKQKDEKLDKKIKEFIITDRSFRVAIFREDF